MKPLAVAMLVLGLGVGAAPGIAVAQCEGGPTVAGHFLPDGTYVSGGCLYTNPTTPGQLYPSGAQPAPSTNPANGASRLPGQAQPAELIPVNSSDLGPAPSLVNSPPRNLGPQRAGTTAGPSVNVQPVPAGTNGAVPATGVGGAVNPITTEPAELPTSGTPALTANRAEPTADHFPGQVVNPTGPPPVAPSVATGPAATTTGATTVPAVTTAQNPFVAPPMSTGSGEPTRIRLRIDQPADDGAAANEGVAPASELVP